MKKILVIGANSYVGARLYVDLRKEFETEGSYHKISLFPELKMIDLTKEAHAMEEICSIDPDVIVHVSSIPSVGMCKKNVEGAFTLNVGGTKIVMKAANKIGARLAYISSVSAQNPQETYSITKAEAEKIVKTVENGFLIIRPGLFIGQSPNITNNRFHNLLLNNIENKTVGEYDDTYKIQPTWLGHLSEALIKLIHNDMWGHVVPITVEEHRTRFEIATDILKNFGVKCKARRKNGVCYIEVKEENTTQEKLVELHLPVYAYKGIIDKTVKEITVQIKHD